MADELALMHEVCQIGWGGVTQAPAVGLLGDARVGSRVTRRVTIRRSVSWTSGGSVSGTASRRAGRRRGSDDVRWTTPAMSTTVGSRRPRPRRSWPCGREAMPSRPWAVAATLSERSRRRLAENVPVERAAGLLDLDTAEVRRLTKVAGRHLPIAEQVRTGHLPRASQAEAQVRCPNKAERRPHPLTRLSCQAFVSAQSGPLWAGKISGIVDFARTVIIVARGQPLGARCVM